MKKLLFDDFQSAGARYVVKEIGEEEKVVPSTRTAQPVPVTGREEKPREFSIGDFFDLETDTPVPDAEPRSEFHRLLDKVLRAVKEALLAHSVVFFWANREKEQLVLEGGVSESQAFTRSSRLPFGEDPLSQVAREGRPLVLGRVNPVSETETIRYYEAAAEVRSLVCVPVFFLRGSKEGPPVGILAADSRAEDAFGPETLGALGNFTKLVSALIRSYTEKYDLLLESELLASIRRMQDRVKSDPSEAAVLDALAEESGRLVKWDYLSITLWAEDRRGWAIQRVSNRAGAPYPGLGDPVDFDASIVGQVIRSNRVRCIQDLAAETGPRFSPGEAPAQGGSFLCIPISSIGRCYGALTLESGSRSNFAPVEVETMYRLVENAASALEVLYLNDMIKDLVAVDQLTGLWTRQHFLKRAEEEVRRAEDSGAELAHVSLAVDDMQGHRERYGREAAGAIVAQVARIVRSNARDYDVGGRWDDDSIGMLLIQTPGSDGYLWAEKVREQIACSVIQAGGTSLSVTVSAGVSGLAEGMTATQLLAGASEVLRRAREDGGNTVRVV